MLLQDLPQCGVCDCVIFSLDPVLDYSPSGIGWVHDDDDECGPAARELPYERLATEWGLAPVDCQCMHGVGEAWTEKTYYWHDYWDKCRVQGRCGYPILDHMRMWVVQEGSPWSSITEPGLKILTSEPYPSAVQQQIPRDSWLWYELGSEFRMFRYSDVSIHHPTTDESSRTVLYVWARPGVGDTDEKRQWRKDLTSQRNQVGLYE